MSEIILIKNNPNINCDKDFLQNLETINSIGNPQKKTILLVLCDKTNNIDKLGKCVSREMVDKLGLGEIEVLEDLCRDNHWNCAIMIQAKVCDLYNNYPAYFTYILGHEIGHANIIFFDENLHIHSCLVTNFLYYVSKSNSISYWDLPIEKFCDKYGIYISETLFSRSKLIKELNEIKDKRILSPGYLKQIEDLLKLRGNDRLDYEKLREDIIMLSTPFKSELIKLWTEDAEENKRDEDSSLSQLVDNYEALFNKKN